MLELLKHKEGKMWPKARKQMAVGDFIFLFFERTTLLY